MLGGKALPGCSPPPLLECDKPRLVDAIAFILDRNKIDIISSLVYAGCVTTACALLKLDAR